MPKKLPPADLLRKLLKYDPETGSLVWLERPRQMFNGERVFKSWNTRYAGKEAFTAYISGYRNGSLLGYRLLAHRVAWAICNGVWPSGQIDHINGIRDDNRINNLREVCNQENGKNTKKSVTNSSGVTGVSWNKSQSKWRAQIWDNGNQKHLGCFFDKQSAILARKNAEKTLGYHENHGRP